MLTFARAFLNSGVPFLVVSTIGFVGATRFFPWCDPVFFLLMISPFRVILEWPFVITSDYDLLRIRLTFVPKDDARSPATPWFCLPTSPKVSFCFPPPRILLKNATHLSFSIFFQFPF